MQEWNDSALLRQYLEQDTEEAFAILVTRHVNKVFSVALRHTRNHHEAEEITQAVFVILARKARTIGPNVILSGWLYRTARLTSLTMVRTGIRRTHREQQAQMQTYANETESCDWPKLAPLLDAAMEHLNEKDRLAIVLRFFDGKSMKQVGADLGRSEDAAKMRINRALEKLRKYFAKKGLLIPVSALTLALCANSIQAAPAMLAKIATVSSVAKGAAASSSTVALVDGTLKLMIWLKTKTFILMSAILLILADVTMRVLELHETFYLCFGLLVCLIMPMMMSRYAPIDPALGKSCLKLVCVGQVLLALVGLVVLYSGTAAIYAVVVGSVGYLACILVLHRKLRRTPPLSGVLGPV